MFNLGKNPFLHELKVKTAGSVLVDILQTIVLALGFSLFIYLVFLIPSQVEGPSMEPNFYNRELLFADRTVQWIGSVGIGANFYDYKKGDVVIFDFNGINLIKRIVATEGDTVRISDSKVYVNEVELKEPYLPAGRETVLPDPSKSTFNEDEAVKVPENSFFLLGDNRAISKDSRYDDVNFVSRNHLKGRVFLRYWPANKFGTIRSGEASQT